MAELGQSERLFGLVADALEEAGVEGVFIGALAAIAWGRIRTTTDVDLVVSASRQGDLLAVFEASVAIGRRLDWGQIDRWAADWGITDLLAPWRSKYEPTTR